MAAAGMSAGLNSFASDNSGNEPVRAIPPKMNDEFSISIFSKHLQWLGYDEMAKVARDMGFEGIDLTVRPEGHVLPENVEKDLPKAMEAVTKAGLKVITITTAVYDAEDPLSEKVLKTASALGIRHYRMGYGYYDPDKSVRESTESTEEA